LILARNNLAQSGVAGRVELRSQGVEHLDDEKMFTLAWLPGPFIAAEIMDVALQRTYQALCSCWASSGESEKWSAGFATNRGRPNSCVTSRHFATGVP
jgi:hypothetical protein